MAFKWMFMLIFAGFALTALTSCDNADTGDEGKVISGTFDRTGDIENYQIRVHVFESRKKMQQACAIVKDMEVELNLDECAIWSPNKIGYGCDVYLVNIRSMTDNGRFSAWGHGLAHCMYGTFHPER